MGVHGPAEHLRDCAFQLEVFSLLGLKLTAQNKMHLVQECIRHIENGVSPNHIFEEDIDDSYKSGPTPSDFHISRN